MSWGVLEINGAISYLAFCLPLVTQLQLSLVLSGFVKLIQNSPDVTDTAQLSCHHQSRKQSKPQKTKPKGTLRFSNSDQFQVVNDRMFLLGDLKEKVVVGNKENTV